MSSIQSVPPQTAAAAPGTELNCALLKREKTENEVNDEDG